MMCQLQTRIATKIKREPVNDSSILDACDVIALPTGRIIAVQQLYFDNTSNHWEFELAQPIYGTFRPGIWYAYTQHISPVPGNAPVPATSPGKIEYTSGRLTAKQLTFLKRTPAQQAGALLDCDKLPIAADQAIQAKQIVGIVSGNAGDHWCFELDGALGGKHRRGVWYAWKNDFVFVALSEHLSDDASAAEDLMPA